MASTPAASVTSSARSAIAYLKSQGWSDAQAAALVGNFQAESGVDLNPAAVGDGGSAYGIAQWRGSRQEDFQRLYGKPIQGSTVEEQLAFVNWELNNTEKSAGTILRGTNNAAVAANVVDQFYERSSGTAREQRIQYANALISDPGNPTALAGLSALEQARINQKPQADAQFPTSSNKEGTFSGQGLAGQGSENSTDAATPGLGSSMPDSIDFTQPLTNILHQYPSYTYGLSLHLLSATEYNNLVGGITYIPNRVLIASAGRYNNTPGIDQFIRSPYFDEDFYFEDFSMTTVIGTNHTSRNTNAIELAFTMIEPYGMTLINRLLDQANDPEINAQNYLDMVYLIQIDFFASNDAGEIIGIVPGITKRFPVKLTQMNIKASVKGSEYQINAVPYNHSAFEQTVISTPASFEISSGSVSEFFQGSTGNKPSFSDAMNGWQQDLVKNNKIGVADTYTFDIDPSISQSSTASFGSTSPQDTVMGNPTNSNSIRQSNLGTASKDYNPNQKTFGVNAGTSIDKVIDNVVRNSEYIQNQMVIPDGMDPQTYIQQKIQNENKPLNWYKIVPTITLGEYDPIRKVNAKNIVYSVKPYTIYNVKSDVAPQGKASQFVKEYNYIYTGKNDDVLDFDINFNTLYYTAQTAYRGAVSNIFKTANSTDENFKNKNTDAYQGATQNSNSVMPMVVKPIVYNAKARATGGIINSKNVAVADLEDSLMTLSAADMLSVQLKIIGDPQFIKQDDCFYSPLQAMDTLDPRLTTNNSLRTDYGEIYVRLMFRTPVDIDESTGLMKFNDRYSTSVFSGIYRVLTVASEFKQGQFTQTLNLIRLPYQVEYDYGNQPQVSVDQRASDLTPTTVSQLSKNTTLAKNVGKSAKITTNTDVGGLSAQQQAQNLLQPGTNIDRQQQDLITVNQTAQTAPITASNAPQAVIPGQ